ncbi:MAG: hypothetical protein HGB37_01430 [Candidatus Moranbacteria bacterium]|nr:hypothetical protein [Candidatus Moranbacteria bacterium]
MRFGEWRPTLKTEEEGDSLKLEAFGDGSPELEHPQSDEVAATRRMLERVDGLSEELDQKVSKKFGKEFLPFLLEKGDATVEYLFVKIADAVDWGDSKGLKVSEGAKVVMSSADRLLTKMEDMGIPIPKKPVGIRVVSSALGIAGCVPCCGVLWGLSALLLKRDPAVQAYFESKRSKLRKSYE